MFFFFPTGPVESMLHNVSVSVAEYQMRDGEVGLSWNVSAPCRLEAEVWLCEKGQPGGQCTEVRGSRQRLHNHTHAGWQATRYGHWVKTACRNSCRTVKYFSGNLLVALFTNIWSDLLEKT